MGRPMAGAQGVLGGCDADGAAGGRLDGVNGLAVFLASESAGFVTEVNGCVDVSFRFFE